MTGFEAASSALEQLLRSVEGEALTDGEFAESLTSALAPLAEVGLGLEVNVQDAYGAQLARYSTPVREPVAEFANDTDTQGPVCFVFRASHHPSVAGFDANRNRTIWRDLVTVALKILIKHWAMRDALTLVVRRQDSGQESRIEKSMRDAATDGRLLAVAYLDLDKFKEINEQLSHEVGDVVLAGFAARLRQSFANESLIVRTGGEEFAIIWYGRGLGDVLPRLEDFRRKLESTVFPAIVAAKKSGANSTRENSVSDIAERRTCCIGLVAYPRSDLPDVKPGGFFPSLYNLAEQAGALAKSEGRNCIRVAAPPTAFDISESTFDESDLTRAAIWARQCLLPGQLHAFGDELHAYFAQALCDSFENARPSELAATVMAVVRRLGLRARAARSLLNYTGTGASPIIHPVKLASIVLHCLLRLILAGKGPLRTDDKLYITVKSEVGGNHLNIELEHADGSADRVQIANTCDEQAALRVYAGCPWTDRTTQTDGVGRWLPPNGSSRVLSPCMLLAIGAPSLELGLQDWVAATVQVDDRPVTGGGLPDFWQSNVSRAVHAVLANPNIRAILIVGDAGNAKRTVEFITNPTALASPGLAARINVDEQALRDFRDRHLSNLRVNADEAAALRAIARLYFGVESQLSAIGDSRNLREEHVRRRRLLATVPSDAEGLKAVDGLRCETLADAYPRVLRLLRSLDTAECKDHMGRRFREVLGFKLVLERPLEEAVPDYWRPDDAELNEYFRAQFMSDRGLFGQRLLRWGNSVDGVDQVARAVQNTVDAIRGGIATRRIIQFIAQPTDERDKPLGLVCIHIVPRENQGRWLLDFQWVWRTVEALVGLPFSAYGSIKFAQTFLELVNGQLAIDKRARVTMGRLTYLALSLHVFLGEGDDEIARTVVTDAYF